jgi:hypothetical protein
MDFSKFFRRTLRKILIFFQDSHSPLTTPLIIDEISNIKKFSGVENGNFQKKIIKNYNFFEGKICIKVFFNTKKSMMKKTHTNLAVQID